MRCFAESRASLQFGNVKGLALRPNSLHKSVRRLLPQLRPVRGALRLMRSLHMMLDNDGELLLTAWLAEMSLAGPLSATKKGTLPPVQVTAEKRRDKVRTALHGVPSHHMWMWMTMSDVVSSLLLLPRLLLGCRDHAAALHGWHAHRWQLHCDMLAWRLLPAGHHRRCISLCAESHTDAGRGDVPAGTQATMWRTCRSALANLSMLLWVLCF